MKRHESCAEKDAGCRPRKVKEFFPLGCSGVCQLCGHGIGKNYARADRREHQTSEQHLRNYALYRSAHDDACVELSRRREAEAHEARRQKGVDVSGDPVALSAFVQTMLRRSGCKGWVAEGEADALKVAMFDQLFLGGPRSRMLAARDQHIWRVRTWLLRCAARRVFAGDHDAVHMLGCLVGAYFE